MLLKILKFKGILKFFKEEVFLKFMILNLKSKLYIVLLRKTEFMGGLKFKGEAQIPKDTVY